MARKKSPSLVVEHVFVYPDAAGDWRWTAYAGNWKIVADSAEGYRNKQYAAKVARDLFPAIRPVMAKAKPNA